MSCGCSEGMGDALFGSLGELGEAGGGCSGGTSSESVGAGIAGV